jgi:protein-L-isoaspartate(D-aspartate) O-methyltransferase
MLFLVAAGCNPRDAAGPAPAPVARTPVAEARVSRPAQPEVDATAVERRRMVEQQLQTRDIVDPRVLDAMRKVPRHRFVPEEHRASAYEDHPLPIGNDVTISQPYIVALMSQLAQIDPGDRVLEIGTGSGYQAAVLAELAAEVHSIEVIPELATRAAATLRETGYERIRLRQGDGWAGWPEAAPFQAILVTAAPPEIPTPLRDQLAVGGRLVVPVGGRGTQQLLVVERTATGFREQAVIPVAFVPMVGRAQDGG